MKNKNVLLSFIFISLIFLMIGCRNKQDHIYISTEVKDLGHFQKNSYWIFKNETTREIDSTYVSQVPTIWTDNIDSKDETLTDHIFVDFESTILARFNLAGKSLLGRMTDGKDCELYYGGIGIGQSKGTSSIYTYVDNYDSFTVNGIEYHTVYHTRYSTIISQSDTLTYDFYMVPHVGPVKITIKLAQTDTTYTLLRYKVTQ